MQNALMQITGMPRALPAIGRDYRRSLRGAGTGVHAAWLAAKGYHVDLVNVEVLGIEGPGTLPSLSDFEDSGAGLRQTGPDG